MALWSCNMWRQAQDMLSGMVILSFYGPWCINLRVDHLGRPEVCDLNFEGLGPYHESCIGLWMHHIWVNCWLVFHLTPVETVEVYSSNTYVLSWSCHVSFFLVPTMDYFHSTISRIEQGFPSIRHPRLCRSSFFLGHHSPPGRATWMPRRAARSLHGTFGWLWSSVGGFKWFSYTSPRCCFSLFNISLPYLLNFFPLGNHLVHFILFVQLSSRCLQTPLRHPQWAFAAHHILGRHSPPRHSRATLLPHGAFGWLWISVGGFKWCSCTLARRWFSPSTSVFHACSATCNLAIISIVCCISSYYAVTACGFANHLRKVLLINARQKQLANQLASNTPRPFPVQSSFPPSHPHPIPQPGETTSSTRPLASHGDTTSMTRPSACSFHPAKMKKNDFGRLRCSF